MKQLMCMAFILCAALTMSGTIGFCSQTTQLCDLRIAQADEDDQDADLYLEEDTEDNSTLLIVAQADDAEPDSDEGEEDDGPDTEDEEDEGLEA